MAGVGTPDPPGSEEAGPDLPALPAVSPWGMGAAAEDGTEAILGLEWQ